MPKYDFSAFDKPKSDKYDFSAFDKKADASDVSYLESILRSGAQGATFGFADEIAGGGEALLDALTGSSDSLLKNYQKHRDESRLDFEAAEHANPMTSFGGSVAGGIVPALFTPAVKGLKGMAAVGAGIGALTGAGSSKADLTQGDLGGFAKDVGLNAAVGGVINPALGSLFSALGPASLEKVAAERAVKATGANKSQMKRLMTSPTADALSVEKLIQSGVPKDKAIKTIEEQSGNRLMEQGKNLLSKNGYTDTPIVTMGASAETILERSQDLMEKSGEAIGKIIGQLDSKYSIENPAIIKDFFNPATAISKIKELQDQFMKGGDVIPLFTEEFGKLQKAIDTLGKYGNKPINFSEAQNLKSLISKTAYNQDGKLADELMSQVRAIVNDGIEDAADAVTKATKDPSLFQSYLKAKDFYRTAKDSYNSSLGKTAGNLVNRDLGITDYMAGLGGAMAHGGPGAVVGAVANKTMKTYGNSAAARVAHAGASVGRALTKVSKDTLKSSGEKLIASGDQLKGKLGRVLIEASGRDDIGRNAVVFSLMQNPAYRNLLQSLISETPEQ